MIWANDLQILYIHDNEEYRHDSPPCFIIATPDQPESNSCQRGGVKKEQIVDLFISY